MHPMVQESPKNLQCMVYFTSRSAYMLSGRLEMQSVPIYKLKFDWTASNLYEQFKLFKQKCMYLLINGPHSHAPANMQVSIFLNWLGDLSYELINTLNFPAGKSKDVLNSVIELFESYFKPSQSTFQSWYELGSIYSSQN